MAERRLNRAIIMTEVRDVNDTGRAESLRGERNVDAVSEYRSLPERSRVITIIA